jgi:hypothetical protein
MPAFRALVPVAVLATLLLVPAAAPAQCITTNPSFEMPGSGTHFAGWNQFGNTGTTATASHGSVAARVSGPNTGNWDVSGFFQDRDAGPGETFEVRVDVLNPSSAPLAGESRAIVNVEWRDGGGNLISYESVDGATPNTPLDEFQEVHFLSGPAPAGTVKARILVANLQGPTDPVSDAVFDAVLFERATPTHSLDDVQWGDFPGGRTVAFSGYTWRVKGPGFYGPGPNLFSDASTSVWVDGDDRLHMKIRQLGSTWYSCEVTLTEALGYGDYIFTTRGRPDLLHPNVVFGLFLWQYGPCYDNSYMYWNPYNEIDVEISRWGNASDPYATQFVAQPWDFPGNLIRFDVPYDEEDRISFGMRWLPDRVEYRCWRGGPLDESPASEVYSWTYTGPHIPRPEQPRVHINLWHIDAPSGGDQEAVLDEFTFRPTGDAAVGIPEGNAVEPTARLLAARPNPFTAGTTFRFALDEAGTAEVAVFDLAGRRVRTLEAGYRGVGEHEIAWDGRDANGNRVSAGVYFYRLRVGDAFDTRRVVRID